MTEEAAEPKPEIWTGPPALSVFGLLKAGFGHVRAHISTLGVLALALTAATAAIRLAAREAGVSVSGTTLAPGYFAYEALVALATAVVSGLMLRAILAEGRGRFALDRGLVAYVGLTAAAAVVSVALTSLIAASDPSRMSQLAGVVAGSLAVLVLIYVFTKLLLWPIGLLMGDASLTAARSWALMRRANWPYIGALALSFLAILPLYVILLLPAGASMDTAPAPFLILEHAVTAAWVTLCCGIAAAVWRARAGGAGA